MAPAPSNAFESSAMLSAFFSNCAAAPLMERDVNGACCSSLGGKPGALRRGASFLDVLDVEDTACLGLPDKASFLIPEDSYLPPAGRENCPARAAPGGCTSVHSAGPCCSPSVSAPQQAPAMGPPRMPSSFGVADLMPSAFSVLAGDEFVHASVCFEKAAQALEMVARPPADRSQQRSDGGSSGSASPTAASCGRVSSLAPSPAASQQAAGSDIEPVGLEQDAVESVCAAAALCSDAAGASSTSYHHHTHHGGHFHSAASAGLMSAVEGIFVTTEMAGAAAAVAAGVGAEPLLPVAPAPKAFHHKTGGPCDHCGATESPQWRRGPPAKAMLCNACGTRYRRTNQLGLVGAHTPAGRAAAAAMAAAAAAAASAPSAGKRAVKSSSGLSAKRNRVVY